MEWFFKSDGMKCDPYKGNTLMVMRNRSCAAYENAKPSHNWDVTRQEACDALRMLRGIVKKGVTV